MTKKASLLAMTVNETLLALTHCVIATESLRDGRQSQVIASVGVAISDRHVASLLAMTVVNPDPRPPKPCDFCSICKSNHQYQ